MIFFDSCVLIAATQPNDPRQAACIAQLAIADRDGGAFALHTLSEMFAVLTRLPLPYRVPSDAALQIVKHTRVRLTPVVLTPDEHLAAIDRFVDNGLTGAMIYDALLMACARKIDADRIYTLNSKDFRRVAPDLASRILEP